ncbi:MAG: molecular chaperone TorD family protein [Xanthobacteraceae bacterium]|jgi:TorA maturation chaperone TorD
MRDADNAQDIVEIDEVEGDRAREYALLAVLLAAAPSPDLLARLAMLCGDASTLGAAHRALAEAAAATTGVNVEREFFTLFVGIGRGELLPYGSYYLTGFLHDRPLAQLRADLVQLGIERVQGFAEPEDHAAVLCDIMAGLVDGRFAPPPNADRDMFNSHLAPWIGRFFADLEQARGADFYRCVGAVGRQFVAIENEAFSLAA